MKFIVQRACEPGATIDGILSSSNGMMESLFNASDNSHYFSALLSNQPQISSHAGIVGLLLVPCAEIVQGTNLTPEVCRLYLLAVSTHVDSILDQWNSERLDNRNLKDLMKTIHAAATICANFKRATISSSGILYALSKLAKGYRKTPFRTTSRSNSNSSFTVQTPSENDTHILTPVHVEFLQCCILASQYHFAKCFVDENPIYAVASSKLLSSEPFLRYHYSLGMIHLGCDDYVSAISAFETCLTVPSKIVSAITIEAWKKILLTKCLLLPYQDTDQYQMTKGGGLKNVQRKQEVKAEKTTEGGNESTSTSSSANTTISTSPLAEKVLELPNAVSTAVHRYFMSSNLGSKQPSIRMYETLVKSFVSLDVKSLTSLMKTGQEQLVEDGNMGLVGQLIPLVLYQNLKKISIIYEAIPLSKLAKKLGVDGVNEVESLLLQFAFRQKNLDQKSCLLSMAPINFSIDTASSVVYFYEVGFNGGDDTEGAPSRNERENAQSEMSKRITTAMDLAQRITKLDIAVTTSSKYQTIVGRENPEESDTKKGQSVGSEF